MIGRRRHSTIVLATLLGVFFGALYLLSGSSDLQHNGDTYLRYQTTQAIVEYHHIWLDHPLWVDTRVASGIGGHLYAFYAPGQSVLMIPLYILGKVIAHHFSLPYSITTMYACRSLDLFLAAIVVVLFFLTARRIGYSDGVSAVLSILLGTATALWPDAQSALEQTQVTLFLLVAVFGLLHSTSTWGTNRRWLIVAGTGVGLAIVTRYDAALYIPVFALYLMGRHWINDRIRPMFVDLVVFGLSLLPWILAVAAWNTIRFGSPFLTGLHERTFGEPILQGLVSLTLSPGKGLLWYVPLTLLLPYAARSFIRRSPELSVLLGMMIVVPLLFYSNVLYWHGDPAWGPRYLYTALPYIVLPLGEILTRWSEERISIRAALLVLAALGLVFNIAAVSVSQWRYWYRLEVLQQRAVSVTNWSGQPFRWGAQHYTYYWVPGESPLLIQTDNFYQVARLTSGDRTYLLTARPDPEVSNPADNYPINTFAFWWTDVRHPLLGYRLRTGLAAMVALTCLCSFLTLVRHLGASWRDSPITVVPAWRAAKSGGG